MQSTAISSLQNTQIKAARKLMQRRYRHEEERLLIEGLRLVSDAWRSGIFPQQVFYNEEVRTTSVEIDALLAEMERKGLPTLACTAGVFASLCETVTPQGIAAIVPLPKRSLPTDTSLIMILDGVRDPGNAGTLLRSAEAAGVDFVIFGPGTVDAFNDKVMRAGMGVHFRLPIRICATWPEVNSLLPATFSLFLADAVANLAYDKVDWKQPAGLVVGGEANGAGDEMRRRAETIAIPMIGSTESLNAAMAGTIILFEAARQRRAS